MYYIDEFLKKKPETFMDYAPGEIPKKPTKAQEPLTLGEVAPKATERVAPRVTTKEESTYTTSDKDLQNIHRNRNNAERHTGRSLRDESNRRTTYVGVGVPDDPHSRKNDSANPYGSPVKIVGDNVTKKDYDDFWTAFRNEGTGSKLNWAANQMQTQPKAQEKTQRQSTPQSRHSQNMMQWAMRERENFTKPQSPGRKQYITDEEDRAFLEGFNQDREEESRWKHMLDTLARGVSDVADKVDTVGDGISTFKNYTDDMNVLDALSATLNDYGKLDDVTNVFFKAYDYAQENPWKLVYAIDSFLDYPSLNNALNGNINRKILYPMGVIANDIMRDKIAKNNYEQNQKVDFSEHYDNDGYINNQNIKDSKMRELRYGDWDMYNNGCELIAVHNSLNSLGNPKDIRDVAKDFEKKGQTLYGYFGTSPYAVGNYFRESGYDVETYEGDDVISSLNLPKADSYILSFWNNNRFTGAIHTESIQPLSDGRYIVFNSDGGEAKITDNLNEYLAKERRYGKRVPLVLHCISKRAKR